jgi:hypothetical protein
MTYNLVFYLRKYVKCKAGWQTLNSNGSNIQAPSLLCGVRRFVLCKVCTIVTAFPVAYCDDILGT